MVRISSIGLKQRKPWAGVDVAKQVSVGFEQMRNENSSVLQIPGDVLVFTCATTVLTVSHKVEMVNVKTYGFF